MEASLLLERYRSDTDDVTGPSYRTDDATFYGYLTEAEDEACVRGNLIRDDSNSLTRIQLVSGTRRYRLDPRIHKIVSARLRWPDAQSTRVCPIEVGDPDDYCDDGRLTGARPRAVYVADQKLVLDPIPNSAGVLELTVYRAPLYPIEDAGDEPEIHPSLHLSLVEWCKFRAFSTKDSEAFDQKRADQAAAAFERIFGPRPTAWGQRHRREHRRNRTRIQPLGGIY